MNKCSCCGVKTIYGDTQGNIEDINSTTESFKRGLCGPCLHAMSKPVYFNAPLPTTAELKGIEIKQTPSFFIIGNKISRQSLSKKNITRLAKKLGFPIYKVMVRGGTNHRKDLLLYDGSVLPMYKDGTFSRKTSKWNMKSEPIINYAPVFARLEMRFFEDECDHRIIQTRIKETKTGYSGAVYCALCGIVLSETVHSDSDMIIFKPEHFDSVGIIKHPFADVHK